MFDNNGQPLRIVVETVPHEVVARLDQKDVQLQNQINSLFCALISQVHVHVES